MSLTDLEHQIETATLVSEKLENDAKAKGGFSRVRSGIRREFSAFRKVLENSKSRLQELQAMQQDLAAMELDETISIHGIAKPSSAGSVASKKISKSPHWLPSLRRKKFFSEGDDRDNDEDDNDNDARVGCCDSILELC